MLQSFSHLGICVGDLNRSTAFYCDVLGFRVLFTMEFGDELAATMEREGAFTSRMLLRDDVRIELLCWHDTAPVDRPGRRRMDRPGLTHLCFRVDEPTELFEIAHRSGGAAWPDTLSVVEHAGSRVQAVYLTDPDGVRIECLAGSPDLSKS